MEALHNTNIERAILSAIVYEPEKLENIKLKADDFYLPFNQNFFKAIQKLQKEEKPVEEEFIKNELIASKKFDEVQMLDLLSANPISNIEAYQDNLIELSNKRKIIYECQYIKENIDVLSSSEMQARLTNDDIIMTVTTGLPPIHDLREVEPKMPEFWIKDFLPIPKREITLLSAGGGSGKSFATLLTGLQLNYKHNLRVYGWFSEDEVGVTAHRARMLKHLYPELNNSSMSIGGKEISPKSFVMKDKGGYRATEFFYMLKKHLKDFDVIIIDPLIAFFGEDENSNTEATFFLGLLNEWCVKEDKSIIVIHHHNKEDKFRGASSFVNSVRMHYSLSKFENNEEDRKLFMEKTNHWKGDKEFRIKLFAGEYGTNAKAPVEVVYEDNVAKRNIGNEDTLDITIVKKKEKTKEETQLKEHATKEGVIFG